MEGFAHTPVSIPARQLRYCRTAQIFQSIASKRAIIKYAIRRSRGGMKAEPLEPTQAESRWERGGARKSLSEATPG